MTNGSKRRKSRRSTKAVLEGLLAGQDALQGCYEGLVQGQSALLDLYHGQNALMERMEEQNRLTYEALTAQGDRLDRRIDELKAELSARLDVLEVAVRKNSEDIRKNSEDIRKNSEDIRKNSEDIERLAEKVDGLERELRSLTTVVEARDLERRVAAIETHLGISR